jgi:hypothetical protein
MSKQIIEERLNRYTIQTQEDEENALKEIIQEIALYALATTDFYTKAQFQGGTALRILYQLPRFSEDLDFILDNPDPDFQWQPYIEAITRSFELYGIEPEVQDRTQANTAIQRLFLKDNSIGKTLNLHFQYPSKRKLLVKLEIDTNPPAGSTSELKYLDFPIDYAIKTQDLPSNFAGKCHALLCQPYEKGRDWFDFLWHVTRSTPMNLDFLHHAIDQYGPWQEQHIDTTMQWVVRQLNTKIHAMDWDKAKLEVARFISPQQRASLELWSADFFLSKTEKLRSQN